MNRFKKISLTSLFTLLAIATLANMAGSATATSAGTANQEKIFFANIQFIADAKDVNDTINLTIENIGTTQATIKRCIVKDGTGNPITLIEMSPSQPVIPKSFEIITLTLKPDTLVDGTKYTITVVTTSGCNFVSWPFDTSSSAEYDPLKDTRLQSNLHATPTLLETYWSSFLNLVVISPLVAAVISVIGAYKLSQYIIGSKNRKDRYILFFFISVIFISIIVGVAYAIWFSSGTLTTM